MVALACISDVSTSNTASLWHDRLGHPGDSIVRSLCRSGSTGALVTGQLTCGPDHAFIVSGLPSATAVSKLDYLCTACVTSKMKKRNIPHAGTRPPTTAVLQLMHLDIIPWPVVSATGYKYTALFTDDWSRFKLRRKLRLKSDVLCAIQHVDLMVFTLFGRHITILRADGEFYTAAIRAFLASVGTTPEYTCAHTPFQNGVAERHGATAITMTNALLKHASLPTTFYDYSFDTALFLLNRLPTAALPEGVLPAHRWLRLTCVDFSRVRVFGCICYAYIPKHLRKKLDDRARLRIFIGYTEERKGYRLYNLETHRITFSRDVVFDETLLYGQYAALKSPVHQDSLLDLQVDSEEDAEASPGPDDDTDIPDYITLNELQLDLVHYGPKWKTRHNTQCETCSTGGDLSACEFCNLVCHPKCFALPQLCHPKGPWACPACTRDAVDKSGKASALPASEEVHLTSTAVSVIPAVESTTPESTPLSATSLSDTGISTTLTHPQVKRYYLRSDLGDLPTNITWDAQLLETRWNASLIEALSAVIVDGTPVFEPRSFKEAISGPHAEHWRAAIRVEIEALKRCNTWDVTDLPRTRRAIGCKWVFKIKLNSDGSVNKFKARMVAKGFSQRAGEDYGDTFAPVADLASVRLFLAIVCYLNLDVHQMDVSTAFLNALLKEIIFMRAPSGFTIPAGKVLKLNRGLYGLKQSPREWNLLLHKFILSLGFTPLISSPCFYVLRTNGKLILLLIFVDDLLVASDCSVLLTTIKAAFMKEYKMTDEGELHWYLGIRIQRDRINGRMTLDQSKYVAEILVRYDMFNAKPQDTPAAVKEPQDLSSPPFTGPYRSAVGALLYLMLCTRPDLAFSVGALCRHNAHPREQDWQATKRVFRYLVGTAHMGLTFQRPPGFQKASLLSLLSVYSDSDWGGCASQLCTCDHSGPWRVAPELARQCNITKSITGYVAYFATCPIAWKSKQQPVIALSSTEAEYMALCTATQTAMWMRTVMEELGWQQVSPTTLYEDNQSTIAIARNPVQQGRIRHVNIKFHYVRECVVDGHTYPEYVQSEANTADMFTKALPEPAYVRQRAKVVQDVRVFLSLQSVTQ